MAQLRAQLAAEDISEADEEIVATAAKLQAEEDASVAEVAHLRQLVAEQEQERLLLNQRVQLIKEQLQKISVTVAENSRKVDARDRKVIELALHYEIAGYTIASLPFSPEVRVPDHLSVH